jgi:RNA polymerase sigma factor (sigma-70 family)
VNEALKLLEEKAFLDGLYGFAYKRTDSSYEAEDLCSDIVLAILQAIRKNSEITNPYAFMWTIAHRVYADFSEKRKTYYERHISVEPEAMINVTNHSFQEPTEGKIDTVQLQRIMREIAFLSKLYRDVCVMYYLDEIPVSEIAIKLGITKNAVKQRLHISRAVIKKGVEKMNTANLTLKPIDLAYIGTGNPVGNDPREVAERRLSKNLVYLCKDTARSAKELSELLGVPMSFVEEEIEIQLKGRNGYYGLLRKAENGKYISNFIMVDYDDYMRVNEMYKRNTDIIVKRFAAFLKQNAQLILNMPFLSQQTDVRFITWSLISRVNWLFEGKIEKQIEENHFKEIPKTKRDFYIFGIATKEGQPFDIGFYGFDGINGKDIGGYKEVWVANMYGRRMQPHFHCGHNISQDPQLLLTIRSIGGLAVSSLTVDEKETAARAIESGYLKKENDVLQPRILVSESDRMYGELINDFISQTDDLVSPVANEMHKFVKNFVPKHLMGEWFLFVQQTDCGLLDAIVEKCIELGTLLPPERTPGAEGVFMVVKR